MSHYTFINKKISTNFIFEKLLPMGEKKSKIDLDGNMVNASSLRLYTFKEKGCTCVICGTKGTHFKLQKHKNDKVYHLGLWTDNNVQMTKDHIMPVSCGGLDILANMQTMCEDCNVKKGNKFTENDIKNGQSYLTNEHLTNLLKEKEINWEDRPEANYFRDIKREFPDISTHKDIVKEYMIRTKTNPYLIDIDDNEDIKKSVDYCLDYYKTLLNSNPNMNITNKKLFGLPKKKRKELFEELGLNKENN